MRKKNPFVNDLSLEVKMFPVKCYECFWFRNTELAVAVSEFLRQGRIHQYLNYFIASRVLLVTIFLEVNLKRIFSVFVQMSEELGGNHLRIKEDRKMYFSSIFDSVKFPFFFFFKFKYFARKLLSTIIKIIFLTIISA